MATDMRVEARGVVRSYSFEVEQRLAEGTQVHILGHALVAERRNGSLDDLTTPWRAFFEPKFTEVLRLANSIYDFDLPYTLSDFKTSGI